MREPQKYRKLPIEVEAMQYDGTEDGARAIEFWAGAKNVIVGMGEARGVIRVATGGGNVVSAKASDWIIRDVAGRYYPCTDHVFKQTYEAVS